MGIPKLFKYLTERYPSLCQTVTANQLPHYDYFYIDLNPLIHKALNEKCHLPLEEVDDAFLTESRIIERVLRYIETLHRIVPSKVLFLANDGVAPRAKWATQRNRRLLAAEKGGASQKYVDANAISPGTIFMCNFEKTLMEFIKNKIKYHQNWQNCDIYISGSSCPGEGSLKIIDFIRSLKQSNDYKSNETHCIYSNDNDYLMLGIATHELYISFLQERRKSPFSLSSLCSDDIKHQFDVMHFELLRQYLRMEFVDCQSKMNFEFNMDNIVDDWVVLMTLIGNDYIPGLPNFNLDHKILTVIYDAYKEVLRSSNGYINECGFLNVRRFARLIQALKLKDFDLYRDNMKHLVEPLKVKLAAINLDNNENEPNATNGSELRFSDFLEAKDQYYTEILGNVHMPDYEQMSTNYVKTIQWMLFYYFRGTCSWSHYYPYDGAPFVGDFVTLHKTTFSLNIDKPVKALTHLLAILPKSCAHLLPKSYQSLTFDGAVIDDNFLNKAISFDKRLNVEEAERNNSKPLFKFHYIKSEKSSNCVKITEITSEKKMDRIDNGKYVDRPITRDDFNFKFSMLNLHDYSNKLIESNILKPYPRMIISLNQNQVADVDTVAKEFLNQSVYINWPHFTQAKVIQVFDATNKMMVNGSNGENQATQNPLDFNTCVDMLNSRYAESGIHIGEIKVVAYVVPLKWTEYAVPQTETNAYKLVEHWEKNKWIPVAAQTLIKCFMADKMPKMKRVSDVLSTPNVFLLSNNSYYFGEVATINDTESLDTNGRIKILAYMNPEPNFENAMKMHVAANDNKMKDFKQLSSAATLLGIGTTVISRITASVLVSPGDSVEFGRKINIGLQLKIRSPYQPSTIVLHDYVKSSGKQFLYSQLAIDLIQEYMTKFPRIFELLSSSEPNNLTVSEFEGVNDQPGLEYLAKIRKWLSTLPHFKTERKPMDSMRLSKEAVESVQAAIDNAYSAEAKVLRLKLKWQKLHIPDMNNVFVVPCPDAAYKLLDRVVVVRSGYPFPVGSKGTVIAIEPTRNHITGDDITEDELFAVEILMDNPYKISITSDAFTRHKIFRSRSTNMLINISHGRAN